MMRALTRGSYGPSVLRRIKIHVLLLEVTYKIVTQPLNILIPRASRFISNIGISIISEYAFVNISRDSPYLSFNRVQAARYSDKSCFVIFVCCRLCRKRISALKIEFNMKRTIQVCERDTCIGIYIFIKSN